MKRNIVKFSATAARRLGKAIIQGNAIPTNEFSHYGHRIHLVPVKEIGRPEWGYTEFKEKFPRYRLGIPKSHVIVMVKKRKETVNKFRRLIKAKKSHLFPAIRIFPHKTKNHNYLVFDGHHRHAAHQAEGKRFIRATIEPENKPNWLK
jgi:hypothetical protein